MEATADPETAEAESHRTGTGVHHIQVDGILLHGPLADHMDRRAPKALSHPRTISEMEAEAADAIEIVLKKPTR